MTQRSNVRPPVVPLTERDARHLLAAGLLNPVHHQGPTRVGLTIGCDEKTVRRARDEETTLRLDLAFNALIADDAALDHLAGHFNKRLVDKDAICDTDLGTLPLARLLEKVAEAESPDSDGGTDKTVSELRSMVEHIRAVHNLTGRWLDRLDARQLKVVAR